MSVNVIGHRGAAGIAMENTLHSFDTAREIGVDYIENDIWELKDGTLVVFHDHLLERVTTGQGKIHELTYEGLKNIVYKDGQKILTLDEYLQWAVSRGVKTIFELKNNCTPEKVYTCIHEVLPYDQYIIRSFFHDKVETIKQLDSQVQTGILFEGYFNSMKQIIAQSSADLVGIGFDSVIGILVDTIKDTGKKVAFWTVDKDEDIADAIAYNPRGIVSNYPDRVMSQRDLSIV